MVAKTISLPNAQSRSYEDKLWPWEYTSEEGGNFKMWDYGPITKRELSRLRRKRSGADVIKVKGVVVHSLIFETAAAGLGNYARWDCINGWTNSLKRAKQNFPHGLHGVKPRYGR